MPAADASGEVFSLSADARYEGVVTGRAGAGGQLSVALEAEACHGLGLEASAAALADVNASLGFLLAARGTGFATAAAGLEARAQVSPDAFDRLGLLLEAAAYAEASAGGRLAIGLDFAQLARWADQNLDGLALDLFLAFLEEIVLEAGAWGRAAVAAMAQAHAEITFSLGEGNDAGVVIEAGAAAGLGAGVGADVYAAAAFTDPRRFVSRSSWLLADEAARQARGLLPAELRWGADALELALPTAIQSAYDLGQLAGLDTMAPTHRMQEPLLNTFADSLRRYLTRAISRAVPSLLEPLLASFAEGMLREQVEVDLAEAQRRYDDLVAYVDAQGDREVVLEDLPVLAGLLLDLAYAAVPDEGDQWREAAAILWTALAAIEGLNRPVAGASASAGAAGAGTVGTSAVAIELPPAPTFVLDAYHARLGRNLSAVTLADAVEFMVAAVGDLLTELNPDAGALFDDLAEQFNAGHGELVEAGLALALGDRLGAYDKVRSALGDWLDNALVSEVVPALRQAAGPAGDDYITEVAAPSLEALSVFLLEKLDAVVSGVPSDTEGAFLDKLSAGCSTILYRLVARNAIYLDAVVNDYVHDSLEQAFADLEAEVRSDPNHVLVRTLALLLPTLHPGNPAIADANAEAVRELVATMASIGRDAFGPRVWSLRRRERLTELKGQILLGVDERADWSDRRAAEAFLSELILCEYVPAETALTELAEELGLTIGDLATVIVPRALSAWGTFLLAITRSVVEEIDRAAREFLGAAAAAVDAALAEVERWRRAVADAIEAAKAAGRALTAALREVERILESNSRRRQITDQLRGMGAAEADRAARSLGADDNAAALAVGAFNVAFDLIVPVLDLAFDAAEEVAGDLADVSAGALDAEEALEEIVEATVDAVIGAINDALSDFGLSLPTELSASDIADAIADSLPTGTLLILLDTLLAASQENDRKLADQAEAERRKAEADDAHLLASAEQAALAPTGRVGIVIGSPAPPPRELTSTFVHGPEVPVLVRVTGASAAFFRAGDSRRVLLAVNGAAITYGASDWAPAIQGFEYTRPLIYPNHNLRPGLNVLEVSVIDGKGAVVRATSEFLLDPDAPSLRGTIIVDPALSTFDVSGDDHEKADQETVAFRWSGRRELAIENWRVQDLRARHVYRIGDVSLAPGAAIALKTGGDPASDDRLSLHWGRRAAVWNNRSGDTVTLVDDHGFVRATLVIPPKPRSR